MECLTGDVISKFAISIFMRGPIHEPRNSVIKIVSLFSFLFSNFGPSVCFNIGIPASGNGCKGQRAFNPPPLRAPFPRGNINSGELERSLPKLSFSFLIFWHEAQRTRRACSPFIEPPSPSPAFVRHYSALTLIGYLACICISPLPDDGIDSCRNFASGHRRQR